MDEASKVLPNTEWWIKSDGCDVVAGLTESKSTKWSGDVDMGDGCVQKQHEDYLKRIELVNHINRNLHDIQKRQCVLQDLNSIQQSLKSDLSYIPTGTDTCTCIIIQ